MTETAGPLLASSTHDLEPLRGGTALVAGSAGVVAVVASVSAAGLGVGWALTGVVAVLAVTVPYTSGAGAALLAAWAWGMVTGFIVNGSGELTFAGQDLERLALTAATVGVVRVLRHVALSRGARAEGSGPVPSSDRHLRQVAPRRASTGSIRAALMEG